MDLRSVGVIVVSIVSLIIFVIALVVAWKTDDPNRGILLGMAGSNATTVVGYWLGSSTGAQKKEDTIAEIATRSSP